MKRPLTWREDWPVIGIPAALHLTDIIFAVAQGYRSILLNEVGFAALHLGLVGGAFRRVAPATASAQEAGAVAAS
jgi:hypothetical protein